MNRRIAVAWLMLCCSSLAQDKSVKDKPGDPPPPPGITVSDPTYPLPLEVRAPFRDLQAEWDETEIDSQKMLVEIEQRKVLIEKNKAKQEELIKKMQRIAATYAMSKKIDLDVYELDPKQLQFAKSKGKAKP